MRIRRRRFHGRRLLASVGLVAAAVLLWEGVAHLISSPYLAVRQVSVVGGPSSVLEAAGLRLGEPLWTLNLGQARRVLLKHDPWYGHATFERTFPDRLRITVVRREPIALVVTTSGGTFGVDPTGMLLPVGQGAQGAYPYLTGMGVSQTAYTVLRGPDERAALRLLEEARPTLRHTISEVAKEGTGLVLYLGDGTKVTLGSRTNLALKVDVLWAILERARAEGVKLLSIDVTDPTQPTVTTPP